MNMMDICDKAEKLAQELASDDKPDMPKYIIQLAELVAELASAASSATDPRLS